MRSPNQPIRYELRSSGGATTLDEICSSVQSEGGFNPIGLIATPEINMTPITISTGWELLQAIRLKSSESDSIVEIISIATYTDSNVSYQWSLLWNPIIAGTINWADIPGSSLQLANGDGITNTITPVIAMNSGYSDRGASREVNADFPTSLKLGTNIDGTRDVVALAIRTVSGSGDFRGMINLKQLT